MRSKTRELTPAPIIQYISLYYFIVILSVSGFVQNFHKGLSEWLSCSLKQPTPASGEKYRTLLVAKGFVAFFSMAKGGGETEWQYLEQHCPLQITETKTPQGRKKIHPFCWVFAQRTGQRGRGS
jgi:hypothetical protein